MVKSSTHLVLSFAIALSLIEFEQNEANATVEATSPLVEAISPGKTFCKPRN